MLCWDWKAERAQFFCVSRSSSLNTTLMKVLLGGVSLFLICSCVPKIPNEIQLDEQLMAQMANYILADSASWPKMRYFWGHLSNLELNHFFSFDDSLAISGGRLSLINYCMLNLGVRSGDSLNKKPYVKYISLGHEEEIRDLLERSFPNHCEKFTSPDFSDKTYLLSFENIPGIGELGEFPLDDRPRPYFRAYGIEGANIICVNIVPTPVDKEKFGPFFGSYEAYFVLDQSKEDVIFFCSTLRMP